MKRLFYVILTFLMINPAQSSNPDERPNQSGIITLKGFVKDTNAFVAFVKYHEGEVRPLFDAICQNGGEGIDEIKLLGAEITQLDLVQGDVPRPEDADAPAKGIAKLLYCLKLRKSFDYDPQLFKAMVLAYGDIINDIQALSGPTSYRSLANALNDNGAYDGLLLLKTFSERYEAYVKR